MLYPNKLTLLYPIILAFARNHTQLSKMHLRENSSGSNAQNLIQYTLKNEGYAVFFVVFQTAGSLNHIPYQSKGCFMYLYMYAFRIQLFYSARGALN